MHKASNQLIISLSPDMLSVAKIRKGRIVQGERIELDSKEWAKVWEDGLMMLDQPLRQLMSRFSSRCTNATVIYHSPTVTQQIHRFDLAPSLALEAGISKIQGSIGHIDPVETCVLSDTSNSDSDTTVLVYSEREEQLRSLYAWLNRCNIRANSFLPVSVASIIITNEIALSAQRETAVFFLGSDVSVMGYATESGIKLIRSAEIGYRKLVDGYIQANIKQCRSVSTDQAQAGDQIDAKITSDALNMLIEHGIPVGETIVNGINLRTEVLPLLAPVLQRFSIEIKQTFRFGLNGVDMPKNLMICGPGSMIPHIGKAFSQNFDMEVQIDPGAESFSILEAFGRGTLEFSMLNTKVQLDGLLPAVAREAHVQSRLTRSLVAGAALAAIVMGGEYGMAAYQYRQISEQIKNDAPRINTVNQFREQLASASSMSNTISDVAGLVSSTVESIPQWQGVLSELSTITMGSIRVQELQGQYAPDASVIVVNGIAVSNTERASGEALNQFVNALKAVDGVSSVTLGSTSRISVDDDQWGRQFSMSIELETELLPHEGFAHSSDKKSGWEMP